VIAAERIYDAAMRLPIVVFTLFLLARETTGIRELVAGHPYVNGDWPFLGTIAARVSVIMFLAVLAALHIARRRPTSKHVALKPKVVAVLGLTFTLLVLLLPRASANLQWDMLSTALILVGNMFSVLSVLDLGRSLSIMPEARKLVTGGLYRRIRHPLYLAEEIATLGLFLQFRSWQAAVILVIHLYLQIRRMDWEEDILSRTFPEYVGYMRRTFRLVPGLY